MICAGNFLLVYVHCHFLKYVMLELSEHLEERARQFCKGHIMRLLVLQEFDDINSLTNWNFTYIEN